MAVYIMLYNPKTTTRLSVLTTSKDPSTYNLNYVNRTWLELYKTTTAHAAAYCPRRLLAHSAAQLHHLRAFAAERVAPSRPRCVELCKCVSCS